MSESDGKPARLCPLIAFDQLVGGKYKLRILWDLRLGARRYGELRRALLPACLGKPVTPRTLSRELKELELRGFVHRKQYPEVPPRVDYTLTERGEVLLPVIKEIIQWGKAGGHEWKPGRGKQERRAVERERGELALSRRG
jgi:DNA-binding HxlR family transcriptional regulator